MSSLEAGGGAEAMRVGSGLGEAEAEACRGASGCGCATFCLLEARGGSSSTARHDNRMNNKVINRMLGQDGQGKVDRANRISIMIRMSQSLFL